MKNIEIQGNCGIKCDNPKCGYVNRETPDENIADWLGVPCPDCGENLLTQEDLDSSIALRKSIDFINSLSPEQLEALTQTMGIDPKDWENISNEATVDVHNGIKFEFKEKA